MDTQSRESSHPYLYDANYIPLFPHVKHIKIPQKSVSESINKPDLIIKLQVKKT